MRCSGSKMVWLFGLAKVGRARLVLRVVLNLKRECGFVFLLQSQRKDFLIANCF
jgi:hypothetical protein